MRIIKDIEKSLNEARNYIESSFIEVTTENSGSYWAFPHFKGKKRVTECGGTSSALAALYTLGSSCVSVDQKIASALDWLYRRQRGDGSWESSGVYCSEVTARILCDIKDYNPPSRVVDSAIEYIISCYNERHGYFLSVPENAEEPHIYTTYICLKALKLYNKDKNFVDKGKIKDWICNSVSLKENWGSFPKYNYGTIAHTVFALYTLSYCEISFETLKREYHSTINWLRQQIKNIENKYDWDEIRIPRGKDDSGTTYYILKIGHDCSALLGELFLELNSTYWSTVIAKKIITSQYSGGWGPEKDKITMWAIEYNADYLLKYKMKFLEMPYFSQLICSINDSLVKLLLCFLGILFFVGNIIWICIEPGRLEDAYLNILISLVFVVLPWIIKPNN